MIIVHHLEKSRSQRVLWLLEELELPYRIVRYARDPKTMMAPPELRQIHPLGKSPLIQDGAFTIPESGAIFEYLVEKADGRLGAPLNREGHLRYRQFLHYGEGSVMPLLMMHYMLGRIPVSGEQEQKAIRPSIELHFNYIESELATRPWFAGDEFTAADVMMAGPLEASAMFGDGAGARPKIAEWLTRAHARPAYQKALAAGA